MPDKMRSNGLLLMMVSLAGCKSVEGIYRPDCVAYAGDTIELIDGHFEWDKFTDQVIVGDDDEIVDQFPDYPVAGTYRVDEGTVSFVADNGMSLPAMHVINESGRIFLLTDEQHTAFRGSSEIATCALVLDGEGER